MGAEYLAILVAGFAGSFHCLGMCGGFACGLGADPRGRAATAVRHLLYNGGRVTTYVFLGALAGTLGYALQAQAALAQAVLSGLAGLLILAMAWQLLGRLPAAQPATAGAAVRFAAPLASLARARGPRAPLALGVANGFLPCPLVYAFLAKAGASASASEAALTMAVFGLGTFPAMLFAGGAGRVLAPVWRSRGVRIAGAFLLVLGLITLARALLPFL